MKRRTKRALISAFACGLLATSTIGVGATVGFTTQADSVRVKPTGAYTGTLTQEINDADLDSFKVYGAGTRMKEPNGFRFLASIDASDLALIPNDAEFGLVIIPNAMLGDAELTASTKNALVAPAFVDMSSSEIPDGGLGYCITLMGETLDSAFPENLYGTVLTARAYVKYTYQANGETVTDYAYSGADIDRSIAYVASCELADLEERGDADTNANSFLNQIISSTTENATLEMKTEVFDGASVTVNLNNANDGVNHFEYKLSSSNEDVAIINEKGEVETVGVGTAVITATMGATKITQTITVKGPETFSSGEIWYSTNDGAIFMPNGLLDDGETIISAVGTDDGVDYFDQGTWKALAQTETDIRANAITERTLTVRTSDYDLYNVTVKSYAGVIDELDDFLTFFNKSAVASEFDATTYPAVTPNIYGYYVVTKNLGTGTEGLSFDKQVQDTDYNKKNGFNGVLDGLGHTLKFKLEKGALLGYILGTGVIKNLGVIYEDATYDSNNPNLTGYGAFGYKSNGPTVMENCYIQRTNNPYNKSTVFGIMASPNNQLILKNTVVHGEKFSNDCNQYHSRMWISASSENEIIIYARIDKGADTFVSATNFDEIVESNIVTTDVSGYNDAYWTKGAHTSGTRISWVGTADSPVTAYTAKYVAKTDKELYYSTRTDEIVSVDGLLASGETIVDAYDLNGVDCYEGGVWTNTVKLTDAEITANATKENTLVVETSKGYFYEVLVKSYAGVIDELSDFNTFFDNDTTANVPSVYGYYVVTQDLGSASDELALVQSATHGGGASEGFNGVLDGQGHTLRFNLTSGGLVGMVLGKGTIENLGVIFKDSTSTKYGVFGSVSNGESVIRNCYIEQTEDHYSKTTTYGIMNRPKQLLILENTLVYGYYTKNDNTSKGEGSSISGKSSQAYVIHARNLPTYMPVNFTKVYADNVWDGSRDLPLSEIANPNAFDDRYWYKENGSLIWKGFETVTVNWVRGDEIEKQNVTKGNCINLTSFDTGYWSTTEGGTEVTGLQTIKQDTTYYAVFSDQTLEEHALYSTLTNEIFLPNAIGGMEDVVSIYGTDSTVYYENGAWVETFALNGDQIKANETVDTEIVINNGLFNSTLTVTSYAGVIDELNDFKTFFDNTAVPSETLPLDFPAVTPNVYGYYAVAKNLGTGAETLYFNQVNATDYKAGNGFSGVLDGMGHTLNFQLGSGALLGYYLSQATIKNIGILYADLTYDANNKGSTGYGIFGARANGVSTLENCYIKRTNNPYIGTSVFGIMGSPQNKLVLNNTVIDGANTTNDGNMHSLMYISPDSTDAFVTYARFDKNANLASEWTIAKNFDEVVASNIITVSDLSGFNANYWTKETVDSGTRITWTGTTDADVSLAGNVTALYSDLVTNSETRYAIVLPDNADPVLMTAGNDLKALFEEATGAELTFATDYACSTYCTYISIGGTKAFKNSGIDMSQFEMNDQGYHIETVNNMIYINSDSSLGCLYGVYGLIDALFGMEQYSNDYYELGTAETREKPVLNITEKPAIAQRMPSNGAVEEAGNNYGKSMRMYNERYFIPAGDYNNGGEWQTYHNALEILPPDYWTEQGKTNWFYYVDDVAKQLCYTAHGNADDYTAMVDQIVSVMTLSLATETYSVLNYPEAVYITLTSEDNEYSCTCSACASAETLYGSKAGAVIKLCNDVREGLETWMNNNPKWKRELKLLFFAYNNYVTAPTVTLNETTGKYEMANGLTMREDVGVFYAVSDYVNYYFDINDDVNADFRAQFDAWKNITSINNSPFCLWTYTKNFSAYMLRADVYGEGRFYNENAYQYFANAGVDLWWIQGASNGTATLSAFEKLNAYLDSQLMWNPNQSVTTLTDTWFTKMYGEGAEAMRNLYNSQNEMARLVFGTTKLGIPTVSVGDRKAEIKDILTKDVIDTWFDHIDTAKSAVASYETSNPELYARYIEHINEEWLSVQFWYVYLGHSKILMNGTRKSEFREVLGYDSTTKTYAKDVKLIEYTDESDGAVNYLSQWIEKSFSGF